MFYTYRKPPFSDCVFCNRLESLISVSLLYIYIYIYICIHISILDLHWFHFGWFIRVQDIHLYFWFVLCLKSLIYILCFTRVETTDFRFVCFVPIFNSSFKYISFRVHVPFFVFCICFNPTFPLWVLCRIPHSKGASSKKQR